ncbi:MAG: hypothetical protein DWH91_10225 [Planctomycetota bacterium]|nr:MAG: hypothetical protein DWH91_10225 [Planctomycetota bacterium]
MVSLTGCSMFQTGFQNLCVARKQFSLHADLKATDEHHRRLAQQLATQHSEMSGQPCTTQPDYRIGFEDGIVDYLTYGGDQRPPLLPPRRYWNLQYRDAKGQTAGQQWLAGCAHGREYAEQLGLRSMETVASSATMPASPADVYLPDPVDSLPATPVPYFPESEPVPTTGPPPTDMPAPLPVPAPDSVLNLPSPPAEFIDLSDQTAGLVPPLIQGTP